MSEQSTNLSLARNAINKLKTEFTTKARECADLYIEMGLVAQAVVNGKVPPTSLEEVAERYKLAETTYRLLGARLAQLRRIQNTNGIPLGI